MADTKLQTTLRAHLEQKGTNARRLSLDAGLHQDAVRNILRGISHSPRGKTLRALADAMGRTIGDLEPTGQNQSAVPLDSGKPQAASPVDEGLLFEVSEHVVRLLVKLGGPIDPARTAEIIILVYDEMAEIEAGDRHDKLIEATENIIRFTSRQKRMQQRKQEARVEGSETKAR